MTTVLQTPFNTAQVEILKLFSQGLTDVQLEELRNLLIEFRFKLLDEQVVKVAEQKGLTTSAIDEVSMTHRRTAYGSKIKHIKNQPKPQ